MKYVLTFVFLFFASLSFAQKELFLTTSAGWKVSYNQVETDKPLPRGLQFSRWSGFSSALGFEYKFSPHWSAHALVKTASMEMGVTERASARFDTATQKFKTTYGSSGHSSTSHAPAHIQLGATYYGNPLKDTKFSWMLGGGMAYLINRNANQVKTGTSSGIGPSSPIDHPGNTISYGKFMSMDLKEEYARHGLLLNLHTGLDFHFAPKHHLLLTLQHNEGLKYTWKFKSEYARSVIITPNETTIENYDVTVRTKGSYSALQLGYKYALFRAK